MNQKILFILFIVLSVSSVNAQFTITTTNPQCSGSYGNADVFPRGNQYRYVWNTGATDPYIGSLVSGIFSCTVTDTLGHQLQVLTDTITIPAPLSYTPAIITVPTSCDSCNGSISLTPLGGTPPYTQNWYNASYGTVNPASVCAGVYQLRLVDSHYCADTMQFFSVNCNCGMNVTLNQTNITCDSVYGSVAAQVSDGAISYTFAWNNLFYGGTSAASSFTGLQINSIWQLTVTDTAGCHYYADGTILDTLGYTYYLYPEPTSANCSTEGKATVAVNGGHAPYTYQWGTSPVQTTAIATGLVRGTYYVTVTDSLGCRTAAPVQIDSSCYEVISGMAFVDTSGGCTYTPGDALVSNLVVVATGPNGTYYGETDLSGQYYILVDDTGTYTLSASFPYTDECGNYTFCVGASATLNSAGDTSANHYLVFTPGQGFDLGLHPGFTMAHPGFDKEYWVYIYDYSPSVFNGSGVLTFQYDPRLVFLSSDIAYNTYNAGTHTFTWLFSNVPANGRIFIGNVHFYVPSTLSDTTELYSNYLLEPFTGDCDTSNNQMSLGSQVTGSRDPNEKDVQPSGSLSEADSVLTYTIHFQNTGTATTSFITVIDTLSSALDPATVVNLASSPEYTKFQTSGVGILTWTFSPAYLPDSLSDPNGSKGFITFTVKLRKGLALGQPISNSAAVYFDYNSAVITNTVTDTVGFVTPVGLVNIGNQGLLSVQVFPNPFNDNATFVVKGLTDNYDFELLDITGRVQRKISSVSTEQFTIPRGSLSAGVYLFRISVHNNIVGFGKVVVTQ